MDTSTQNKQLVRESIDCVWNARRVDEVGRFLAADFVDHGAAPGTPPGPDGFAAGVRRILAAFPDACNTIDEVVAEADRVVVRWTMTGTHVGDELGFPATGRAVRLQGVTISRVAAGRIAEHWSFRDDVGLLRQLGLMP